VRSIDHHRDADPLAELFLMGKRAIVVQLPPPVLVPYPIPPTLNAEARP
jgi:hypothetical protein